MRERTVRIDVTDEQLKGLVVGTEIDVTIKGKVKEARAEDKPTKKEKKEGFEGWPGHVELKISDDLPNEFADLAED